MKLPFQLTLAIALCCFAPLAGAQNTPRKPNVIVIVGDVASWFHLSMRVQRPRVGPTSQWTIAGQVLVWRRPSSGSVGVFGMARSAGLSI